MLGAFFHAALADPSILPSNWSMQWGPLIKQRQDGATAATQSPPMPILYIEDREQFESLPAFDWGAISRMVPPLQQGITLAHRPSTSVGEDWGSHLSFLNPVGTSRSGLCLGPRRIPAGSRRIPAARVLCQ